MRNHEHPSHPRGPTGRTRVRDWQPLFGRLRDATDWALDITRSLARDYDEEIAAVERVRGYVHGWLDGRRVDIDLSDVLTTLAILFAAIELDLGIDTSPVLAPLRTLPEVIRLPGAARDELPTVVIRRAPCRRVARGQLPVRRARVPPRAARQARSAAISVSE
jgi:hypothetical protein